MRETKRVLLVERQRGIDAIDHILHRVSCECVPASQRGTDAPRHDGEVSAHG